MIKKYTKYLLLFSLFCLRIPFLDTQASEHDEIAFVFNRLKANQDDYDKYKDDNDLDYYDLNYIEKI